MTTLTLSPCLMIPVTKSHSAMPLPLSLHSEPTVAHCYRASLSPSQATWVTSKLYSPVSLLFMSACMTQPYQFSQNFDLVILFSAQNHFLLFFLLLTSLLLLGVTSCPPVWTYLSFLTRFWSHLLREALLDFSFKLHLTCLYLTFAIQSSPLGVLICVCCWTSGNFPWVQRMCLAKLDFHPWQALHRHQHSVPRSCSFTIFQSDNLPLALPRTVGWPHLTLAYVLCLLSSQQSPVLWENDEMALGSL